MFTTKLLALPIRISAPSRLVLLGAALQISVGSLGLSSFFVNGALIDSSEAQRNRRPLPLTRTFEAVVSGNWNSSATWGGGGVPGLSDTCSISDGVTVTVSDAESCGTSPPAGTVVLQLNHSGNVTIVNGGTLTIRGDVQYTGGFVNGTDAIDIFAGGSFVWDSSLAAFSPSVHYSFRPSSDFGFRQITSTGTAASHATIRSNNQGGSGSFSMGGHNYGGSLSATFTDFSYIGTRTISAWEFMPDPYIGNAQLNVTHSTFDHCGIFNSLTALPAVSTYIWNNNVHTNSIGASVLSPLASIAMTGGTRSVVSDVFDIDAFNVATGQIQDFTATNNYFGSVPTVALGTTSGTFTNSLIRVLPTDGFFNTPFDESGLYIFVDHASGNPHLLQPGTKSPVSFSDSIIGKSGGPVYGDNDSGEVLCNRTGGAPYVQLNAHNLIMLPDASGYGFAEWAALVGGAGTSTSCHGLAAEHLTRFAGFQGSASFAGIQLGEGNPTPAGSLTSYRSNIDWNPELVGMKAGFFKIYTFAGGTVTDVAPPAMVDYNDGYPTGTAASAADISNAGCIATNTYDSYSKTLINQGNCYASAWSTTPGVHDVNADPRFVDYQRSLELYDTRGLGHAAGTPWTSRTMPAAGAIFSNARPDKYWGLTINYRYINGPGCGALNPEPGNDTPLEGGANSNWRNCWEWATLFDLRQGVAGESGYSPTIISDMIAWVQAGYIPQNPALINAGHDQKTIGAVK